MNNEEKGFSYSYSAVKQREIDRIVAKYTDDGESKYQQLLRLDDSVETVATVTAIIYTIISILVFGAGLSIVLVYRSYIFGSAVCVIGISMLFFISKVRKFVLARRRRAIKSKILEIAKDISEV